MIAGGSVYQYNNSAVAFLIISGTTGVRAISKPISGAFRALLTNGQ